MRLTVRSSAVLRVLRYFVLSFFLVMLQTVVLPRVFPGALPDLMLPAVIAAAMGEDERIAALFGAFGGFFLDAAGHKSQKAFIGRNYLIKAVIFPIIAFT